MTDETCDGYFLDRPAKSIEEWTEWRHKYCSTKYDLSKKLIPSRKKKRCKSKANEYLLYGSNIVRERTDESKRTYARPKTHRSKTAATRNKLGARKARFRVFVKTPVSIECLQLMPDVPVQTVADIISKKLGIASDTLQLFCGNLRMSSLLSLEDHGITDESNIDVQIGQGLLGGADEGSDTTKTFASDQSKTKSPGTDESAPRGQDSNNDTQRKERNVTDQSISSSSVEAAAQLRGRGRGRGRGWKSKRGDVKQPGCMGRGRGRGRGRGFLQKASSTMIQDSASPLNLETLDSEAFAGDQTTYTPVDHISDVEADGAKTRTKDIQSTEVPSLNFQNNSSLSDNPMDIIKPVAEGKASDKSDPSTCAKYAENKRHDDLKFQNRSEDLPASINTPSSDLKRSTETTDNSSPSTEITSGIEVEESGNVNEQVTSSNDSLSRDQQSFASINTPSSDLKRSTETTDNSYPTTEITSGTGVEESGIVNEQGTSSNDSLSRDQQSFASINTPSSDLKRSTETIDNSYPTTEITSGTGVEESGIVNEQGTSSNDSRPRDQQRFASVNTPSSDLKRSTETTDKSSPSTEITSGIGVEESGNVNEQGKSSNDSLSRDQQRFASINTPSSDLKRSTETTDKSSPSTEITSGTGVEESGIVNEQGTSSNDSLSRDQQSFASINTPSSDLKRSTETIDNSYPTTEITSGTGVEESGIVNEQGTSSNDSRPRDQQRFASVNTPSSDLKRSTETTDKSYPSTEITSGTGVEESGIVNEQGTSSNDSRPRDQKRFASVNTPSSDLKRSTETTDKSSPSTEITSGIGVEESGNVNEQGKSSNDSLSRDQQRFASMNTPSSDLKRSTETTDKSSPSTEVTSGIGVEESSFSDVSSRSQPQRTASENDPSSCLKPSSSTEIETEKSRKLNLQSPANSDIPSSDQQRSSGNQTKKSRHAKCEESKTKTQTVQFAVAVPREPYPDYSVTIRVHVRRSSSKDVKDIVLDTINLKKSKKFDDLKKKWIIGYGKTDIASSEFKSCDYAYSATYSPPLYKKMFTGTAKIMEQTWRPLPANYLTMAHDVFSPCFGPLSPADVFQGKLLLLDWHVLAFTVAPTTEGILFPSTILFSPHTTEIAPACVRDMCLWMVRVVSSDCDSVNAAMLLILGEGLQRLKDVNKIIPYVTNSAARNLMRSLTKQPTLIPEGLKSNQNMLSCIALVLTKAIGGNWYDVVDNFYHYLGLGKLIELQDVFDVTITQTSETTMENLVKLYSKRQTAWLKMVFLAIIDHTRDLKTYDISIIHLKRLSIENLMFQEDVLNCIAHFLSNIVQGSKTSADPATDLLSAWERCPQYLTQMGEFIRKYIVDHLRKVQLTDGIVQSNVNLIKSNRSVFNESAEILQVIQNMADQMESGGAKIIESLFQSKRILDIITKADDVRTVVKLVSSSKERKASCSLLIKVGAFAERMKCHVFLQHVKQYLSKYSLETLFSFLTPEFMQRNPLTVGELQILITIVQERPLDKVHIADAILLLQILRGKQPFITIKSRQIAHLINHLKTISQMPENYDISVCNEHDFFDTFLDEMEFWSIIFRSIGKSSSDVIPRVQEDYSQAVKVDGKSKTVVAYLEAVRSKIRSKTIRTRNLGNLQKYEEAFHNLVLSTRSDKRKEDQFQNDFKSACDVLEVFEHNLNHLNCLTNVILEDLKHVLKITDLQKVAADVTRLNEDHRGGRIMLSRTIEQELWSSFDNILEPVALVSKSWPSVFYQNICRSVFRNSKLSIMTVNECVEVLSHKCIEEFNIVFQSSHNVAEMTVEEVGILMDGIQNANEVNDAVASATSLFSGIRISSELKAFFITFVKHQDLEQQSKRLLKLFTNFDIPVKSNTYADAAERIIHLKQTGLKMKELHDAISKISTIADNFSEDDWEIIVGFTDKHSQKLVQFLKILVENNDDLRNLISAAREKTEAFIDVSVVVDLTDVKRYFKPLHDAVTPFYNGNETSANTCTKHLIEAISSNTNKGKDMAKKVKTCVKHIHGLKNLYKGVSDKDNRAKDIIKAAREEGSYIVQLNAEEMVCSVSLKLSSSKASYGLDKLNDLRGRALLISGSENVADIESLQQFVECVDTLNVIVQAGKGLIESGHLSYRDRKWNSGNPEELKKIHSELKQDLKQWQSIIREARDEFYYLNYLHASQIYLLEQYFTNNDVSNKENVRLLLKFLQLKLREKYNLRAPGKSDLSHRVSAIGSTLHGILQRKSFEKRRITKSNDGNRTFSQSKVIESQIFVAEVDEKSTRSVHVMLELYRNTTGNYPEPHQVVFCDSNTKWETVHLLLRRCLGAFSQKLDDALFCLVNVELLAIDVQLKLMKEITRIQNEKEKRFLLAIICRDIQAQVILDHFPPKCIRKPKGISDEMFKDAINANWPEVEVLTSTEPGLGKTEYVINKANEADICVTSVPVSGPITKDYLIEKIKGATTSQEYILHLDVATVSNSMLLDTFIFELVIVGMGLAGTAMCDLSTDKIMIEIENTPLQRLENSLTICNLFNKKVLKWNSFTDFVFCEHQNSADQIVCHYLLGLEDNTINKKDIVFSDEERVQPLPGSRCSELLERFFKRKNIEVISFSIVRSFINLAAEELRRLSSSLYFSVSSLQSMLGDEVNDVRSTLVRAIFEIAKEYSTRNVAGASRLEQDMKTTLTDQITVEITAKYMVGRVKGMLKFIDINHVLLMFHRVDSHTFSLVCRSPEHVPAGVKNLLEFQLPDIKFPDCSKLVHEELQLILRKICRPTRAAFDEQSLKHLETNYALTGDNLMKMLLIYMRISSHIPVIIMGETGCGKTTLITYLARVCDIPFMIFNVHAGRSEKQIKEFVREMIAESKRLKKHIWGFFDEVNTCEYIGVLNEIICHHRLDGKPLPDTISFLAACNPFQLRKKPAVTDGCVGKVVLDERSKLVYRVNPLPETMMDYVWDYGSLNENEEAAYIKRMVKGSVVDRYEDLFSKLLLESQKFLRLKEETSYCVSLRDVDRCIMLCKWFQKDVELRVKYPPIIRTKRVNCDPAIRSIILALAHCYHARLNTEETRSSYRTVVSKAGLPYTQEVIKDIIMMEQSDIINRMEVPHGVAKNEALKENIFVILVCVLNRVPVFLVGKPGCSKSLSVQIILNNIRGQDSDDTYFKNHLPALLPFPYQGNETSTSGGIEEVFKCALDMPQCTNQLPVVLLDEIGLAQASPYNPLKVLHSLLEPEPGARPKVGVIGLSNWAVDAAKMNRAIYLSRPDPSKKDLSTTAHMIGKDIECRFEVKQLDLLVKGYHRYQMFQRYRNFHGLRDFYNLIKFVVTQVKCKKEGVVPVVIIQEGILRNFGGLRHETEEVLNTLMRATMNISKLPQKPRLLSLIEDNLRDKSARHLMLVTNGDSAVSILQDILQAREHCVIFGSQFKEDTIEDYSYRILNRVILFMERKCVLILRDLDHVYGSLYDMLNQNYTKFGQKQSCRVALGVNSNCFCPVHEEFRCIVLVDEKKLPISDPPLLSRFEKQTLRFSDILDERQIADVEEIRNWVKSISTIDGYSFGPNMTFMGYQDDTVPSLVYHYSKEIFKDQNIQTNCKEHLLRLASPDGILRASRSNLAKHSPVEMQYVQDQYFALPVHQGIRHVLSLLRKGNPLFGEADIIKERSMKLLVYTHSSIHFDVKQELANDMDIHQAKLSRFKSERQLDNYIQEFFGSETGEMLVLQCNPQTDAPHMLFVKCKLDRSHAEFNKREETSRLKHICLMIHCRRGTANDEDNVHLNFLGGWKQITIDTLQKPKSSLSQIYKLSMHDILSQNVVKIDELVSKQFLTAFNCIRYTKQAPDYDSTILLANKISADKRILQRIEESVLEDIKTTENTTKNNNWIISVASDIQLLGMCGTLTEALEEYLEQAVGIPLARIVILLEKHGAWESIFGEYAQQLPDDARTEFSEVWYNTFEHVITMANSIPTPRGPESIAVDTRPHHFMYPFFGIINEKIDELAKHILLSSDIKTEKDFVDKVSDSIPTIMGHLIDDGYLDKNITTYQDDFCDIIAAEHAPSLPTELRHEAMLRLLQALKPGFDTTSKYANVAKLHVTKLVCHKDIVAQLELLSDYFESTRSQDDNLLDKVPLVTASTTRKGFASELVSNLCKCLLPTEGLLGKYNNPREWASVTSPILIRASRVSQKPAVLHILRVCLDFINHVTDSNTNQTNTLVCIGDLAQKDEALDTTLQKILEQLQQPRDQFICQYFSRCLDADPETSMVPKILAGLDIQTQRLQSGSRPVLLRLLQKVAPRKDETICTEVIRKNHSPENVRNIYELQKFLQTRQTIDSHIAVASADIVQDVAFSYITFNTLERIAESKDGILMKALRIITSAETDSFQLICAVSFLRAILKVFAEKVTCVGHNLADMLPVARELGTLLQTRDTGAPKARTESIRYHLLKLWRANSSLFETRRLCETLQDDMEGLKEINWQNQEFRSKLGYSPMRYVKGYVEVYKALDLLKTSEDSSAIKTYLDKAQHIQETERRLCLLAASNDIFYLRTTISTTKDADRRNADVISDLARTMQFAPMFLEFLQSILGIKGPHHFREHSMFHLTDNSQHKEVRQVSVFVHLVSVMFSRMQKDIPPSFIQHCSSNSDRQSKYLLGIGPTKRYEVTPDCVRKGEFGSCKCSGGHFLVFRKRPNMCPTCKTEITEEMEQMELPGKYKKDETRENVGYVKHQHASNATFEALQTVRDLLPASYRVVHLLFHGCIAVALSTDLLSPDEASDLLKESEPERSVQTLIEEDWQNLKFILNLNDEETALFLHGVLEAASPHLNSNFLFYDTSEIRDNIEGIISSIVSAKSPREIIRDFKRKVSEDGKSTIDEFDTYSSCTLARYFRDQVTPSFKDFEAAFLGQAYKNQKQFPFLQLLFGNYRNLEILSCLKDLLAWSHRQSQHLNGLVRRDYAEKTSFASFFEEERFFRNEEEKQRGKALFESFKAAWNKVVDKWEVVAGHSFLPRSHLKKINLDNPISCGLPTNDRQLKRNQLRLIVDTLANVQNSFLQCAMAIAVDHPNCQATQFLVTRMNISAIPIISLYEELQQVQGKIIRYHFPKNYLHLCDVDTEYGKGDIIRYDFSAVERQMANTLLNSCAFLDVEPMFTTFSYSDELFHAYSSILAEVKHKVTEASLPKDIPNVIRKYHGKDSQFAKSTLEKLETILLLIKKTGGYPNLSLQEYASSWSKSYPTMSAKDYLPEDIGNLKLKHVVKLYLEVELLLAPTTIEGLHKEYCNELTDETSQLLAEEIQSMELDSLQNVHVTLQRFTFRYLRSNARPDPKLNLLEILHSSVGATMNLSEISNLLKAVDGRGETLKISCIRALINYIRDAIKVTTSGAGVRTSIEASIHTIRDDEDSDDDTPLFDA